MYVDYVPKAHPLLNVSYPEIHFNLIPAHSYKFTVGTHNNYATKYPDQQPYLLQLQGSNTWINYHGAIE